jgi:hypothetical protein
MGNVLYRIIALLLTLLCLPFGIWASFNWFLYENHAFDSQIKLGISSTFWGLIMLNCLIRGRPPGDKISVCFLKRQKKHNKKIKADD